MEIKVLVADDDGCAYQQGYILPDTLKLLCHHTLVLNQRMSDTIRHILVNKNKKPIALQEKNSERARFG